MRVVRTKKSGRSIDPPCGIGTVLAVSPPLGSVNWVEMFMPMRPFSSTYFVVLSMIGAVPVNWMGGGDLADLVHRRIGVLKEIITTAGTGADAARDTENLLPRRLDASPAHQVQGAKRPYSRPRKTDDAVRVVIGGLEAVVTAALT